jgi:RNA recognition motif-containing protein
VVLDDNLNSPNPNFPNPNSSNPNSPNPNPNSPNPNSPKSTTTLLVKNLPGDVVEAEIESMFSRLGLAVGFDLGL